MSSTSSQPAISSKQPPELPNEIFLLIIQRCPGATLKHLRLVSKNVAQMTTPFLWRRVVLVPNYHCILAFVKALKRSKILHHITKLIYDGRFGTFLQKLNEIAPDKNLLYPPLERAKELAKLDRTYEGHFKSCEDISIEIACLSKALRLLPSLKQVCILEFGDGSNIDFTEVPSFYLKICRTLRVDPASVRWNEMEGGVGRSYSKAFLTAAFSADCKLHTLKARGIDGRAIFGILPMKSPKESPAAFQQFSMFKSTMDSLRELEFSFRNDTLISTAHHVEAVQQLLKAAKRLRTLKLRFTDCSTYSGGFEDMPSDCTGLIETSNGTWLCKPLMPRLEMLNIGACICHDEDLMHFLKIHSATLRRLEFSNMTLLSGDSGRECWVRLIKHLKTDLKLASMKFSGWFSNGGRQQWSVAKDTVGKERLKSKVESYVVDRRIRQCPLEPVAIRPYQQDVEKPASGEEFEGDLTWTMVYSHRGGYPTNSELAAPSFGTHSTNVSVPSSESGDVTPPYHSNSDSLMDIDDAQYMVQSSLEPSKFVFVDPNAGTSDHQSGTIPSLAPLKMAAATSQVHPTIWGWTHTSDQVPAWQPPAPW